jgi:type II secretory pathway component GspD/PulD (secretin)
MLLAAAGALSVGCAGANHRRAAKGQHDTRPERVLARQEGQINPPQVISGSPDRDAVAYDAANEKLTEADWKQLERFGPRPIWEQLQAKQRQRCAKGAAAHRERRGSVIDAPSDEPETQPAVSAPLAQSGTTAVALAPAVQPSAPVVQPSAPTIQPSAPATQPSAPAGAPAAAPSTQPTTQPAGQPTTQPSAQPTTRPTTQPLLASVARPMPLPPEDELPVDVVELPDGKLRMVWRLRSYGGTSVDYEKNGSTSRRNLKVTPSDLTPLVTVLTQYLGQGGMVVPLPKENTLVIMCPKETRASVLNLLNTLDVPARQVEITAKIFEVSRDFDFQQGTELVLNRLASSSSQGVTSTFSAKRFLDSVGGNAPTQGSVLKLMQTFADAGVSVDLSFQLLAESGMINVVSSPRMTVAVGQTGYMLAGQELPIQSANIVNNVLTTATTYKPVGVQLYVTPQAVGRNRVKLHTISIVSSVSGFSPLPTLEGGSKPQNMVNPIIDSREAETAVTVDDGSTLVISGLRMVRVTTRENKIPGLGDLPILGWMFKNHRTQQQQTDLYFFLTPTLL